jgi:hypothetical protein
VVVAVLEVREEHGRLEVRAAVVKVQMLETLEETA